MYSKLHASTVNGEDKACRVDVVNFIEADDGDAFDVIDFSQLYTPPNPNSNVRMVHVILHKEAQQAKILTADRMQPLQVSIDRSSISGHPRLLSYRRSQDW